MRDWNRRTVGGAALITGGLGLAVFWIASVRGLSDQLPWIVALGVHGASIVLLSTGVLLTASGVAEPPWASRMTGAGAWVTVAGHLTVFPLIPVGFAMFGAGHLAGRRSAIGTLSLIGGAGGVLAIVALGARVGFEDAPPLTFGLRHTIEVGTLLAFVGFALIGLHAIRSARAIGSPGKRSGPIAALYERHGDPWAGDRGE